MVFLCQINYTNKKNDMRISVGYKCTYLIYDRFAFGASHKNFGVACVASFSSHSLSV